MRQNARVAGLAIFLAMTGCAPAPYHSMLTVEDTPYDSAVTITGRTQTDSANGYDVVWNLRSVIDKKDRSQPVDQLDVMISYAVTSYLNRKDFLQVSDDQATSFQAKRVLLTRDKDNGCRSVCREGEEIRVTIPLDKLRSHAAAGYDLRFTSRFNEQLFVFVSAAQIQEQLRALDAYQQSGRVPGAVPAIAPGNATPLGFVPQNLERDSAAGFTPTPPSNQDSQPLSAPAK